MFAARYRHYPELANHYYAYVSDFIELDQAIGFRDGDLYRESQLRKADGTTNKGSFGRAVRPIPRLEFEAIIRAGLSTEPDRWDLDQRINEPVAEYEIHPVIERLVSRKYRDLAFCCLRMERRTTWIG